MELLLWLLWGLDMGMFLGQFFQVLFWIGCISLGLNIDTVTILILKYNGFLDSV